MRHAVQLPLLFGVTSHWRVMVAYSWSVSIESTLESCISDKTANTAPITEFMRQTDRVPWGVLVWPALMVRVLGPHDGVYFP